MIYGLTSIRVLSRRFSFIEEFYLCYCWRFPVHWQSLPSPTAEHQTSQESTQCISLVYVRLWLLNYLLCLQALWNRWSWTCLYFYHFAWFSLGPGLASWAHQFCSRSHHPCLCRRIEREVVRSRLLGVLEIGCNLYFPYRQKFVTVTPGPGLTVCFGRFRYIPESILEGVRPDREFMTLWLPLSFVRKTVYSSILLFRWKRCCECIGSR